MNCQNHGLQAATATCSGCAEAFCTNCVVAIRGVQYCGGCKQLALPDSAVAITSQSEEALKALRIAILSIFCFGFIMGPIAIVSAVKAHQEIGNNPAIGGKGKAKAAIVIASTALLFSLIGLFSRFASKAS
jgi:hypothetical protein